jgi:hypothetical protein
LHGWWIVEEVITHVFRVHSGGGASEEVRFELLVSSLCFLGAPLPVRLKRFV